MGLFHINIAQEQARVSGHFSARVGRAAARETARGAVRAAARPSSVRALSGAPVLPPLNFLLPPLEFIT